MVARYFQTFPQINYNSYDCIDITRREKIIESIAVNPYVFYPIDLQDGQRPDIIADKYYGDSYYSWLVWLSNNVLDPVLGWHLDSDDFYKVIVQNYGSIQYTQRKITKWRTNWDTDFSIIPPATFAALGVNQQAYWSPNYDVNFNVMNYTRANVDIDVNTNLIVSITPDVTSNVIPAVGDLVSFVLANNIVGTAEVITSNTSNVVVNNVIGNYNRLVQYSTTSSNTFTTNDTVIVANSTSNTTGSLISANSTTIIVSYQGNLINGSSITLSDQNNGNTAPLSLPQSVQLRSDFGANTSNGTIISFSYDTLLSSPIPQDQVVYYEPAYVFDLLDEHNAEKQSVHLLDSSYSFQAYQNLMNQIKD
ncbi:MAG: baseplate wedge protein 53 [Legionella sp.]|uniref:baseplate wedge protein 53 n=1 Tax=Legionella sp. TaxID=459 RepID=UPI0028452AD1|nr:baseplate wedge protein 53 [Legionella sp.]